MASSATPALNKQHNTTAPSSEARSTLHLDPNPPPVGLKRGYGEAADGGGVHRGGSVEAGSGALGAAAQTDQATGPPESGATASGPPSASASAHHHHHVDEDDGTDTRIDATGLRGSDTPTSSTDAGSATKKRRTNRRPRGVANLTAEQLERKRANDREAQRAIRERQRLRTVRYESEIAELKSKQPYQELQGVLHQKAAIETELADVKRCLAAIMAMVQPILAPSASGGVGRHSPAQTHALPTQPLTAPTVHSPGSTPTSATSPASAQWQSSLSPVAPPVGMDGQQAQPPPEMVLLHQQRYGLVHGLDLGSDRLGLDFLVDPSLKIARIQGRADGAQDSPQYRHVPMKHDWTAAISNLPGMQGQPQGPPPHTQRQPSIYNQPPVVTSGLPLPTAPASFFPPASTPTTTASKSTSGNPPSHSLVPRNCPSTCPLDTLLLGFLAERRQRFAEGLSQAEILGPRYPSVSSLLNPAVSAYSHPVSKVFTDILARFPDLSTLPERVAVLYLMFLLMRWQVSPTAENHARLPAWFRPLPVQTEREHPAWFDHIPFPRMREKLVREYEPGGFPFDNFFIPFTSTLSLNWPYEDAYVLLASPSGDELMINPVFEQHLGVLGNWTLGEKFEKAYPALRGCFNLKRGGKSV